MKGKIYRDGINAVIAGRPNVGKSSLLNRLLGEKRAIVTAMPGTTRDFIEETISIKGVPVKLTDTAGIREPQNIIEKEGVNLVWEKLSQADVVIVVVDGSETLNERGRSRSSRGARRRNCSWSSTKPIFLMSLTEKELAGLCS